MHKRKSITAELEETTMKSSKKARPAMSVVGMYFLSPSHWLVCMAAWKVRLQPACLIFGGETPNQTPTTCHVIHATERFRSFTRAFPTSITTSHSIHTALNSSPSCSSYQGKIANARTHTRLTRLHNATSSKRGATEAICQRGGAGDTGRFEDCRKAAGEEQLEHIGRHQCVREHPFPGEHVVSRKKRTAMKQELLTQKSIRNTTTTKSQKQRNIPVY
jgi:hypothetical protein